MPRLPLINQMQLTAAQKDMYEEILRVRGQVRGPFAIWLNSPELGSLALQIQDWFQKKSALDDRIVELSILIMARKANAQFAWAVHEQRALKYGIEHTIIEAIKMRCTPKFNSDIELLTYDLVNELNETKTLSSVSYQKAIKHFSLQALVELVSLTGFYVMVAMILNSFEADTPTGEQLLF